MLKLEQKQTQTLSNKMIESLQVLQMSRGELAERLEELYAENPLLELDERGEAAPQPPEAESLKKLEWLARFDEQNAAYMRQEADDDEDGWLENIAAPQEETLADSLMEQLAGRGFGDCEMKVFRYIAESLDERGYFTERAEELASRFGIETREAERLLGVMKRLDRQGYALGASPNVSRSSSNARTAAKLRKKSSRIISKRSRSASSKPSRGSSKFP